MGLDVSLRSTGISVINTEGKLIYTSLIQVPTGTSPLYAGKKIAAMLETLANQYTIQATVIEDVPLNFGENLSSSLTRFILTRISGIVAYEVWRLSNYNSLLSLHYPNTIRSYFQLSPSSDTKKILENESKQVRSKRLRQVAKDHVIKFIMLNYPNIPEFSTLTSSSTADDDSLTKSKRKTKKTTKQTEQYTTAQNDIADATLIAMYAYVHYLEYSVLKHDHITNQNKLFNELLHLMIPTMRIGHTTISPNIIPLVAEELQKFHTQTMMKESHVYHDQQFITESINNVETTETNKKPKKRKKQSKTDEVTTPTKTEEEITLENNPRLYLQNNPDIIDRLYNRIRQQYTILCRTCLIPDIINWKYLSS